MKLRILALVVAISTVCAAPAFAAGAQIELVGAGTMFNSTTTAGGTSTADSSHLGFGGGLLVEFMAGGGGLQIGALYLMNKISNNGTTTPVFTLTAIDIPVQYRFRLGPGFSLGLGGYYDIYTGSISSDTGGTNTYAQAGINTSDYGATASLEANISKLVLGVRYNYGLSNNMANAPANSSTKFTNIIFMAGVRFGT